MRPAGEGDIRRSPRSALGAKSLPRARYGRRMGFVVSPRVVLRSPAGGQAFERRPGSKVQVGEVRASLGPAVPLSVLAPKANRQLITPCTIRHGSPPSAYSGRDSQFTLRGIRGLALFVRLHVLARACPPVPGLMLSSNTSFAVGLPVHARHTLYGWLAWEPLGGSSSLSDPTATSTRR